MDPANNLLALAEYIEGYKSNCYLNNEFALKSWMLKVCMHEFAL